MYGKKSMGTIRSTFLIDKNLTVKNAWHKVKVKGHVDEVLSAIASLD
jgi:peroxiredoxin Q/BCP